MTEANEINNEKLIAAEKTRLQELMGEPELDEALNNLINNRDTGNNQQRKKYPNYLTHVLLSILGYIRIAYRIFVWSTTPHDCAGLPPSGQR